MIASQLHYLVVGSDSLIGSALKLRFEHSGLVVTGTTRRREAVSETCRFLDLSDARDWHEAAPDVAIICAGITKIQACQDDAVASARINVEGVVTLAKKLVSAGAFLIYLSTNQVFDGTKPYAQATDSVSPQTEYGRQKAAAEKEILRYGDAAAIMRFSKVLEPKPLLFSTWIKAMRSGDPIHPFSDMFMAPLPLSLAVEGLYCVARARAGGIFQMSAARDISYEQAARHLARRLDLAEALVQPIKTADAGLRLGSTPQHTTLDASRIQNEFGIAPPEAWSVVETSMKP